MAPKSISFKHLLSFVCLFNVVQTPLALADPGLPDSIDSQPSQSSLNGEFKDAGIGAQGTGSAGLRELKPRSPMFSGKAKFDVSQEQKMPPVAPPIQRMSAPNYPPMQRNGFRQQGRYGQSNQRPLNGQVDDSRMQKPEKKPFFLGAKRDTTIKDRPSWLPAHAYSNANMVAPYHNSSLMWWDKSAMPNKPQWVVLSTSVTKYWRGRAPNPCWILVAPNPLAPGHFTFRSKVRYGPRGWLQALDRKSAFGFPLYRYWLDQPQF